MDLNKQDVAAREPVDLNDDAEFMDTGVLHADRDEQGEQDEDEG